MERVADQRWRQLDRWVGPNSLGAKNSFMQMAAEQQDNGCAELWGIDMNLAVKTTWQPAPGGTWRPGRRDEEDRGPALSAKDEIRVQQPGAASDVVLSIPGCVCRRRRGGVWTARVQLRGNCRSQAPSEPSTASTSEMSNNSRCGTPVISICALRAPRSSAMSSAGSALFVSAM